MTIAMKVMNAMEQMPMSLMILTKRKKGDESFVVG